MRVEEVVEHNLGSRFSHLVSVGVDGVRPQLSVAIDEHEGGGAHRNVPIEDAGNKGVIRKSKSRVVTDADEFEFTSTTGLHLRADIDVTFPTC